MVADPELLWHLAIIANVTLWHIDNVTVYATAAREFPGLWVAQLKGCRVRGNKIWQLRGKRVEALNGVIRYSTSSIIFSDRSCESNQPEHHTETAIQSVTSIIQLKATTTISIRFKFGHGPKTSSVSLQS